MAIMRPSVENTRSLGNFTQMFRWSIMFLSFPSAIAFTPTVDDINFRAQSAGIPELAGETTTIAIRGNEVRQPGIHKWNSPWAVTLVETTNPVANQFIWEWSNLCWQSRNGSTGVTQNQADLECDVLVYQLNNLDQPIFAHKLYGCFLENATLGQLDSQTSDPQAIECSIAFQRCEREKV